MAILDILYARHGHGVVVYTVTPCTHTDYAARTALPRPPQARGPNCPMTDRIFMEASPRVSPQSPKGLGPPLGAGSGVWRWASWAIATRVGTSGLCSPSFHGVRSYEA